MKVDVGKNTDGTNSERNQICKQQCLQCLHITFFPKTKTRGCGYFFSVHNFLRYGNFCSYKDNWLVLWIVLIFDGSHRGLTHIIDNGDKSGK